MSELPAILELHDLRVSLGGRHQWLRKAVPPVHAVAGVSFSVRQGEILGLVGESGCGKTTLGRAVLGLQRETSGEIYLDGRLVTGAPPKRARVERNDIHYVHQDAAAALDPWWSIGRTLEEGLIIHGVRKANERRARVREMLAAVGLDESVLPRYPHELSGGQLRRVTLARILVLQPRFIIFDEPTSGLDMSVQAMVLNLLLELRRSLGLTYLFISHDLSVVERFCDRVAIMYLGRIVELAPTGKIFATPRHPYTRALLAAIPRLTPEPKRARQLVQTEPPTAACLPAGCAFSNRCPHVEPACISTEPALDSVLDHQVACRRWQELRSDARAA
jgi:oligopeptide/dipeptide ABC transporter ATP-binding protein